MVSRTSSLVSGQPISMNMGSWAVSWGVGETLVDLNFQKSRLSKTVRLTILKIVVLTNTEEIPGPSVDFRRPYD